MNNNCKELRGKEMEQKIWFMISKDNGIERQNYSNNKSIVYNHKYRNGNH